jgi:hypothetical protein
MWRSPNLVRELVKLKGKEWMKERMEVWRDQTKQYTGRMRKAWFALETEWSLES